MNNDGFYYLHSNGELIFKRERPEEEQGGFVQHVWEIDTENRASAWKIILESLALGSSINRVKELCNKWECDAKDLVQYVVNVKPSNLERKGIRLYLSKIAEVDPEIWFDWLAKTPVGEQPDFNTVTNHGASPEAF